MNPTSMDEYARRKRESYYSKVTRIGSHSKEAEDRDDDGDEDGGHLEDFGDDRSFDAAELFRRKQEKEDAEYEEKEAERASLDKSISEKNIGYKMLLKMGWKENTGLGKEGMGIAEPIRIDAKADRMGLGRSEYEQQYVDPENIKRSTLLSELPEDHELVVKHSLKREKEEELKKVFLENTRPFYCELCDKQYRNAMEMDVHLSSYEHNHKKRFLEMKALQNQKKTIDTKKREKLNEEREIKRLNELAKTYRQKEAEKEAEKEPVIESEPNAPISNPEEVVPKPVAPVKITFGLKSAVSVRDGRDIFLRNVLRCFMSKYAAMWLQIFKPAVEQIMNMTILELFII